MANILVVDDSGYQRHVLKGLVKEWGYNPVEAKDGAEGVKLVHEIKPSLVMLDIVMPNMDGIAVLEKLRHDEAEVPVVVITADIQESTKKKCMDLGAVGFVNKPVKGAAVDQLKNIVACYVQAEK